MDFRLLASRVLLDWDNLMLCIFVYRWCIIFWCFLFRCSFYFDNVLYFCVSMMFCILMFFISIIFCILYFDYGLHCVLRSKFPIKIFVFTKIGDAHVELLNWNLFHRQPHAKILPSLGTIGVKILLKPPSQYCRNVQWGFQGGRSNVAPRCRERVYLLERLCVEFTEGWGFQ